MASSLLRACLNQWTSRSNSSISLRLHPIRFPCELGLRPLLGKEHWLSSHLLSLLACQRLEKSGIESQGKEMPSVSPTSGSFHIPFFFFYSNKSIFKKRIKVKPFHSTVFHGAIKAEPWVPSPFIFRGLYGCSFLVRGAL